MRTINEILTEINQLVEANLVYASSSFTPTYYTIASLQEVDGKTWPIVNEGDRSGTKISPRDSTIKSYHRIIDSETQTDPNGGKGKYPYRLRKYTIRNVWIGEWKAIPSFSYEFNDDIKNDVYSAFPVVLTQKERIFTTNENVNKIEVLGEEYPEHDFNNLSLELIAFYIEYEIHQRIRCA